MNQYLLSTYYTDQGSVPGAPNTPEEMQQFMQRVAALEDEMEASGAFAFGGALHGADAASVLRPHDGDTHTTEGPFVDADEQLAGFYIVNADDLDGALMWAGKVVEATRHPIEVRPFRQTGRVRA